jgi:hypothetical protein
MFVATCWRDVSPGALRPMSAILRKRASGLFPLCNEWGSAMAKCDFFAAPAAKKLVENFDFQHQTSKPLFRL